MSTETDGFFDETDYSGVLVNSVNISFVDQYLVNMPSYKDNDRSRGSSRSDTVKRVVKSVAKTAGKAALSEAVGYSVNTILSDSD